MLYNDEIKRIEENDQDASSTRPMKSFRRGVHFTELFFFCHGFYPNEFFHDKVFNEVVCNSFKLMDNQGELYKQIIN